jgi:hypothetical protein
LSRITSSSAPSQITLVPGTQAAQPGVYRTMIRELGLRDIVEMSGGRVIGDPDLCVTSRCGETLNRVQRSAAIPGPHRETLKAHAYLRRLPELYRRREAIEKHVAAKNGT